MQYKYNLCWHSSHSTLFIQGALIENARWAPAAPSATCTQLHSQLGAPRYHHGVIVVNGEQLHWSGVGFRVCGH